MMKTYIAGPMTGYPNYNWDQFYLTESILENSGIKTANPARITDEMGGQELFLKDENLRNRIIEEQKRIIKEECDSLFLLKGWEKSIGAKEELKLALEHNLEIILEGN